MNYSWNKKTNKYEYKIIGEWMNDLKIESDKIQWINNQSDVNQDSCTKPCKIGEIKKIKKRSCCWECVKCKEYEFIVDDHTCKDCGKGKFPYPNRSLCYAINVNNYLF